MDLPAFRRLLTPAGQAALAAAQALEPREADFLSHFTQLSRSFPADLARPALETAILRLEARTKFPSAEKMYFTRPALEQSTPQAVSAYRAGRFEPFDRTADLACSVGGDTLSLAAIAPVLALDLDPLRLEMARANLAALGLAERTHLIRADLSQPLPFASDPNLALFFDPARRTEGRRIFSVEDYHPPLRVTRAWLDRFAALGVKISPGVDLSELESYDAEVEFISLQGELKEAVLWFGPLKTASRRATLITSAQAEVQVHTLLAQPAEPDERALSEPLDYLYEPDPAILRAGLVTTLGAQLGAAQLDPEIAYLTGRQPVDTPFARRWQVEAWLPFQLKRLRAYLRERRVGQVVVKKRGSPLQPEALIRDLRLQGEEQRVVFLTQLMGKPVVVVCFEI